MAKWRVYGIMTASFYAGEVEADTAAEAEDKAWDELQLTTPGICHHCAGKVELSDVHEAQVEPDEVQR